MAGDNWGGEVGGLKKSLKMKGIGGRQVERLWDLTKIESA